jgi:DHA2 family multidrug resistance protein-like MFS transporter
MNARPKQDILPSAAPRDGLPAGQRGKAFLAIGITVALATLDTSITNTALPGIASNLHAEAASSIWVINAYQLAVLAAILPVASLGEVWGHRNVYTAGLVLFTLTSLACGFAWSLPSLVLARALQGLGAAAVMSVNTALIRFIFPMNMLGRGVGLNALVVAIAFTLGPTVASAILSIATWHWLFLVNVPAGVVAIVLSLQNLPTTPRAARDFDVVAALLCAGLFAFLILAIGGAAQGDSSASTLIDLALAAGCGALLFWRQAHDVAPMLPIDLFREPLFALSALTAICSFAAQGLAFVSLPFLLQHNLGHNQVETGFLMTPWPALVAVMAPIAGRLSDRYPPGLLGGIGLVMLSIGMASLALLPTHPSTADLMWRLVLCGAGFGFFQSPNLRAIMTSAPAQRSGGASGTVATARLLGQTSGAALVALCFHLWHDEGPWLALWIGCCFSLGGSVASFLRLFRPGGKQQDGHSSARE